MGPLIDTELELVDRRYFHSRNNLYCSSRVSVYLPSPGKECPKFISVYVYYRHAQLTRISTELVDALNLYHQLMHEGQAMQHHAGYGMGN